MKVRELAIRNFSSNNIKSFEPYSVLEDVFVPLYFYHRYQVEAATKVIGGLDYNYAVKSDGQFTTKSVDKKLQEQTLNAIINTLRVETLAIPKNKLSMFPPRAYGFNRTRESFQSQTGVAFDPFSAVNTASDMTLKLLLHPERANRLVIQNSLDENQLSLHNVLNALIQSTFGIKHEDSYFSEVQHQININVLKYIMNLAVNNNSFFQVQAKSNEVINNLSSFLNDKKKLVPYANQYLKLIIEFKSHPEKFKIIPSPKIPDGSPIGSGICTYNH